MKYVEFDETRPMDLILLGRVAIDFNPSEDEPFGPLENVRTFKKYVGGSPANIAVWGYKTWIKSRISWKSI